MNKMQIEPVSINSGYGSHITHKLKLDGLTVEYGWSQNDWDVSTCFPFIQVLSDKGAVVTGYRHNVPIPRTKRLPEHFEVLMPKLVEEANRKVISARIKETADATVKDDRFYIHIYDYRKLPQGEPERFVHEHKPATSMEEAVESYQEDMRYDGYQYQYTVCNDGIIDIRDFMTEEENA